MNTDALRFIDRWIGLPICSILTLSRSVVHPFRPKTTARPRKILIIKLAEMGSTVLAYPGIMEMKRRLAPDELFVLVFEKNRAIFDALNITKKENIISVRSDLGIGLIKDCVAAIWRLWNVRLDATVDMDFFSRFTASFAFVVCRGRRVGFHSFEEEGLYRGNLLTHRVMYSPHIHTSEAFLALTRTLCEETEMTPFYKGRASVPSADFPSYQASRESKESIQKKIRSAGLSLEGAKGTLIIVNPNSSNIFPLRKWPLESYCKLSKDLLAALPEASIVITGSASEAAEAENLVSQVGNARCVSLSGKTTFPELLALYEVANLMVTNDSGPAHFAALSRLPSVVLFGPETPRLYKPLSDTCRSLYAEFSCSPCVSVYNGKKSFCRDNKCLQAITPEMVHAEILDVLHK